MKCVFDNCVFYIVTLLQHTLAVFVNFPEWPLKWPLNYKSRMASAIIFFLVQHRWPLIKTIAIMTFYSTFHSMFSLCIYAWSMCVCAYVRTYVYCTCVHMYVVRASGREHTCTHACIHMYTYVYVCVCCMRMCVYVCIHMHVCTYIFLGYLCLQTFITFIVVWKLIRT